MTLCTDIKLCFKDSNCISPYRSSVDRSIKKEAQKHSNKSHKEKMAPKVEDEKIVRHTGDVYETDSERSVMSSNPSGTRGRKSTDKSDSNQMILKNVLHAKGYAVGKELGRGSFAVVFGALNKEDQFECAIKVVDTSKAPSDFVTHFFPRELEIIRLLQHKNIISVMDIIKVNWQTCIVMERADKGDILDYLVQNGPMADSISKVIFKQICLGMEYCHNLDIAHRDLKCENVLLSADHQVKIADFGFARYVVNKDSMRILSQTYCGSAAYAAPEILQGQPYNPLMSDIWSLGIILYVMINAVMPFDDTSHRRMLEAQRMRKWSFHPDRRSHISPNCRRVIRGLLEPDITRRSRLKAIIGSPWLSTPSAENFLGDLAQIAKEGGKTIS